LSSRALIHIGGGRLQLPGLQLAVEAGLEVVLTDADPSAPGRALAARWAPIRGDDVPGLLDLARSVARETPLAGAYCSNDFGVSAVAAIGAELGIPACAPEAARDALDKVRSTATWRAAGIATTRGTTVATRAELERALAELGLPLILKPAGKSGSIGVRSACAREELEPAWRSASAHGLPVVVEHLERGRHFDVNGTFVGGRLRPGGVLERFFGPAPEHVPEWGVHPTSLDWDATRRVYRLLERAALALGIAHGPVKADVVWGDAGPLVLEVAPRYHGDVSTAHVLPLSAGTSPIADWMRRLAGGAAASRESPEALAAERGLFAGWRALRARHAGELRGARGVDAARAVSGVHDVALLRGAGFRVEHLSDNRSVCGFVWARGASHDAVRASLEEAAALVEISVDEPAAAARG